MSLFTIHLLDRYFAMTFPSGEGLQMIVYLYVYSMVMAPKCVSSSSIASAKRNRRGMQSRMRLRWEKMGSSSSCCPCRLADCTHRNGGQGQPLCTYILLHPIYQWLFRGSVLLDILDSISIDIAPSAWNSSCTTSGMSLMVPS